MKLSKLLFLSGGLLSLASASQAQETHFALHVEQQPLALSSSNQNINLDYGTFHIRLGEQISPDTRIDLILGNSGGSTEKYPDTTGLDFEGIFGGFNLTGALLDKPWFQLNYNLHYTYHNLAHEAETQTSRFVWHELGGEIEFKTHLYQNTFVYACARYVDIKGQLLQEGTIQSDTNFRQGNHHSQCAGIYMESGVDGYYGVELHNSEAVGGSIYFGRFLDM